MQICQTNPIEPDTTATDSPVSGLLTPDYRQQLIFAAIAQPHPDESGDWASLTGQMEEVLVFANQHHFVPGRILPNLTVGSLRQADLQHVMALDAFAAQRPASA